MKVNIDLGSVAVGHEKFNASMVAPDFFDTAKFPQATYAGKLAAFANGAPTRIDGSRTLHGVTKPLTLTLDLFKCIPHPMLKQEICGADAIATVERDQFGLDTWKILPLFDASQIANPSRSHSEAVT